VGTTPLEGVALVGIENLTGSSLGDTLSGSGGVNVLTGGKGADELLGLGGNDRLDSRDGINRNDSLNGGAGTNRCVTDTREASIRNCS
jgi:Ca2+-binding RTX toxin-like protein